MSKRRVNQFRFYILTLVALFLLRPAVVFAAETSVTTIKSLRINSDGTATLFVLN